LRILFPADQNRAPPEQKLLTGKFSSKGKSRAKAHQTDAILKKFYRKKNSEGLNELQIYPIKPSAAFSNLVRLSL
jgi:hypothetical protein